VNRSVVDVIVNYNTAVWFLKNINNKSILCENFRCKNFIFPYKRAASSQEEHKYGAISYESLPILFFPCIIETIIIKHIYSKLKKVS
jgi:hypothetical protein